MTPITTRWPVFNWPGWARWAVTLSFLTLLNWLMLAPVGVFRHVHVFLAIQDKIAHLAIFLLLALLVRWSLPGECGRGWLRVAALAALLIYAGSIELTQPLLKKSGRAFEWLDMACNFAGIVAGWLLFGKLVFDPGEQAAPDKAGVAAEIRTEV